MGPLQTKIDNLSPMEGALSPMLAAELCKAGLFAFLKKGMALKTSARPTTAEQVAVVLLRMRPADLPILDTVPPKKKFADLCGRIGVLMGDPPPPQPAAGDSSSGAGSDDDSGDDAADLPPLHGPALPQPHHEPHLDASPAHIPALPASSAPPAAPAHHAHAPPSVIDLTMPSHPVDPPTRTVGLKAQRTAEGSPAPKRRELAAPLCPAPALWPTNDEAMAQWRAPLGPPPPAGPAVPPSHAPYPAGHGGWVPGVDDVDRPVTVRDIMALLAPQRPDAAPPATYTTDLARWQDAHARGRLLEMLAAWIAYAARRVSSFEGKAALTAAKDAFERRFRAAQAHYAPTHTAQLWHDAIEREVAELLTAEAVWHAYTAADGRLKGDFIPEATAKLCAEGTRLWGPDAAATQKAIEAALAVVHEMNILHAPQRQRGGGSAPRSSDRAAGGEPRRSIKRRFKREGPRGQGPAPASRSPSS